GTSSSARLHLPRCPLTTRSRTKTPTDASELLGSPPGGVLAGLLEESKSLGFLGPGPVAFQVEHALALFEALADAIGEARIDDVSILDLGAGGGVPGLVIGLMWPQARLYLLDSNHRRCEFLSRALDQLGLTGVTVLAERAESAAHDPRHRASMDAVVARGFGKPSVTAECGAPFLKVGGSLVVSEPPAESGSDGRSLDRWPSTGSALLGLEPRAYRDHPFAVQTLTLVEPCPDTYPRRVGVAAKRPLF
ncbi:MAG TPA: RsmG family class I SAM-dependent methyltransferase, partial [Acidimicrobiales bacterium]|nr:RsmG family class I SAM-dependent methyltransferase [Acidimicrobiales bacterium]